MNRSIYTRLLKWKSSVNRKPLLIQGARQVGKTFIVKEFGENEYQDFVHLNFERDPDLKLLFQGKINPLRIIEEIGFYANRKIQPKETLIFFDEIQECEEAITSLKYFHEEAAEYQIIAAGSLLGVAVGKSRSFPVGKVNFMTMYPMSFGEFLWAYNENLLFDRILKNTDFESFPKVIHEKLIDYLKIYLFVGGMPEVLDNYIRNKDINSARKIQNEIIKAFQNDFSKYSTSSEAVKIREVWQSIPFQLAKENKKFKYNDVRKKARASHFESSIEWLNQAGLIYITYNISAPKLPISGYADRSKFKIYLLDTGLLGALLDVSPQIIIQPNQLFKEFNGAFIENFVASELSDFLNRELYYWSSKGAAEVDFIISKNKNILPVEVKSGTSRNLKSLQVYAEKYAPDLLIRASPRNYHSKENFRNLPLYAIFYLSNMF